GPVARAAGIPLTASTAPGPTAEQVEGAQDMSPEDRQAMIKSMVSGLADRLATDGGTPVEWARLIRAYGVLGETGNANAIWLEAKETFASNEDAMSILREAARAAEIIN
ncbi:MAG: c-type cytochrome biogenesis protein CcmI, partial [Paracoccaceae bacterium]